MKRRAGFTLLEVLVALLVLSVGLMGAMGALVLANRTARDAAKLQEAVRYAERELTLATQVAENQVQNKIESQGQFTCNVAYENKPYGLYLATATVRWSQRSQLQSYQLSKVFRPIRLKVYS